MENSNQVIQVNRLFRVGTPAWITTFGTLPSTLILSLFLIILPRLYRVARTRLCSDLTSLPSPPVPFWRKYIHGHGLLPTILRKDAIDCAEIFNEWRSVYGRIFLVRGTFGLPIVQISSASALRKINITSQSKYVKTKYLRMSLGTLIGQNGILLAEGAQHAMLRANILPALHYNSLLSLETIFLQEAEKLTQKLKEQERGIAPDVLRLVREATCNVILDTSFGEGVVSREDSKGLQDAFLASFLEPPAFAARRFVLQTVFWFLPHTWFGYREDLRTYIRDTVRRLCRSRSAQRMERKPLLQIMTDDAKYRIEEDTLIDTVLSFLSAGQATTSISVCWFLYLLGSEESWQTKVYEEIKANWKRSDGLDALDSLPLLSRAVKECLRLYPPVMYETREMAEDGELEGYRLLAGTLVRCNILALQRCRDIWGADADIFNPDRFLRREDASTKMYFMPFLYGSRSCIGQRFAVLEIKAFVAMVLLKHKIYVKKHQDPRPFIRGVFATPRGMKVYFEPRANT